MTSAELESVSAKGEEGDSMPNTSVDSALHSNIKTKGQNSYYYAHKKREGSELHEWDGKAAPRLLKVEQLNKENIERPQTIKSYAWSDGKKRVSVYITLPGVDKHPEELIELTWATRTLDLRIKEYEGKTHVLSLNLYEDICDVLTKRKENQLVLMLQKAKEFGWYSLQKETK